MPDGTYKWLGRSAAQPRGVSLGSAAAVGYRPVVQPHENRGRKVISLSTAT